MTELERLAQAFADALSIKQGVNPEPIADLPDSGREVLIAGVRAVLSALLPPSEGAVEAAAKVVRWVKDDFDYHEEAIGEEAAQRAITAFVTHMLEE